jgi:dTDP-glucose 4,6-dehydratase
MNQEIKVIDSDERIRPENSEVNRLWADNSKAIELLSWKPEYASLNGLKKGLEETVNWFKKPNNLNLYKSEIYNV